MTSTTNPQRLTDAGSLVEVEGLHKAYGRLPAVNGVSFQIHRVPSIASSGRDLWTAQAQRSREDHDARLSRI